MTSSTQTVVTGSFQFPPHFPHISGVPFIFARYVISTSIFLQNFYETNKKSYLKRTGMFTETRGFNTDTYIHIRSGPSTEVFVSLSSCRSYRNPTNLRYHWDQTGPEDDSNTRQCYIQYYCALLGNRTLPEDVPLDSVSQNVGNCGSLSSHDIPLDDY
jgi:hypothetical protein